MNPASDRPHLRLVGAGSTDVHERRAAAASADAVARANREAGSSGRLDPSDPRWVLAVRTRLALEGPMLRPERRAELVRLATRIGLRSFDANVIIATVQEQARSGGTLADAASLIETVPGARPRARERAPWPIALLALASSVGLAALFVRWIVG